MYCPPERRNSRRCNLQASHTRCMSQFQRLVLDMLGQVLRWDIAAVAPEQRGCGRPWLSVKMIQMILLCRQRSRGGSQNIPGAALDLPLILLLTAPAQAHNLLGQFFQSSFSSEGVCSGIAMAVAGGRFGTNYASWTSSRSSLQLGGGRVTFLFAPGGAIKGTGSSS